MPKGKPNKPNHPYSVYEEIIKTIVSHSEHYDDKESDYRVNKALSALFGNWPPSKTDPDNPNKNKYIRGVLIHAADLQQKKRARSKRDALRKAIQHFYPKYSEDEVNDLYKQIYHYDLEKLRSDNMNGADLIISYIKQTSGNLEKTPSKVVFNNKDAQIGPLERRLKQLKEK